ncbi:MAG TPA: Fe-S cluster assembly protein SufD [Quisquiliibacterium sp.]|nr:Fe-S cluster assembly protein SufD [Quisquiliibacterium sp.]
MSSAASRLAAFPSMAATLPGAALPWLAALRGRAIERFAEAGWPNNRLENWRHTSLAGLEQQQFAAAGPVRPEVLVAQLRAGEAGHWLVFVDGAHAPALSDVGALPAGALIEPLSGLLARDPAEVEALYGSAEDGESPSALNAALATDGAVIRLARGVAVEAPIHLVFIGGVRKGESHLRNLVRAEAGSQATVVEHYVGEGEAATLTSAVTRIVAGADARIVHLKLQQETPQAVHLAAIDAFQARGSSFDSHALAFGARLARTDIRTRFEGEGCEALLNGLYHVDGRRHVDHHTRIDHAQPRGTSREFYRGILDGAGRGVFTGRIVVAPGAQRTDAQQRTDSLLLSPQAHADARPELEIYADDVKCAHGATVGQINDESLFYLRSRGIDEAHARNLLTWAFAAEALARIGVDSLRRRAEVAIRSRLPGGAQMEAL